MTTLAGITWETIAPRQAATGPRTGRGAGAPPEHDPAATLIAAARFARQAARASARLLVLINDPARATPTRWVLEGLATHLPMQERPPLSLLVATGTHRFEASERAAFERATLAGCGLEFAEVAWHDCLDERELSETGGPEPAMLPAPATGRRAARQAPVGDRGHSGPKAPVGDRGHSGPKAPVGDRGHSGPKAPVGDRGHSGPQAPVGDRCHSGRGHSEAAARINRRVVEHDWILAIGSVEPHYFAGATGAHKTLTIGCLARADIERNHAGALHPASDLLALDGNPVFDGIALLADGLLHGGPTRPRRNSAEDPADAGLNRAAPLDPGPNSAPPADAGLNQTSPAGAKHFLALNQVAAGERVLAAAAGGWRETLEALLPVVRTVYTHQVARPADVLHLRVPLPLGRDLYQADKALKNCHQAVRDGGLIILEADCPHGVGPDAFLSLLRRAPDYAAACEIVRREGYRLSDHKAVKLRHLMDPKQRGVRVVVVSANLRAADVAGTGLELRARLENVEAQLQHLASATRGIAVEDAGNSCITRA